MKDDKNNLIYLDYNGQTIFRTMHLTEPDGWLSPPHTIPYRRHIEFYFEQNKGPVSSSFKPSKYAKSR